MEAEVIDDAYLQCQQICKNASTTFYSSFSALGYEKRRAVHAVYALCRWVDDIVDGDEEPIVEITERFNSADKSKRQITKGNSFGENSIQPTRNSSTKINGTGFD